MLTKYILHINGTSYELQDDDLKNWDDIRCSYRRSDYDGVVRSFTSQFEFVNNAYALLMEAYMADRFNADVTIDVLTMTSAWTFETRFSCPLDFSTVSWDSHVLKINAIDNSLSSLIKANKGTKYEFAVGSDIPSEHYLNFERLPMISNLVYEFTKGTESEGSGLRVTYTNGSHIWIGNIGAEIAVPGFIDYRDDQTEDTDSYILKALNDIEMTLDCDVEYRADQGNGGVELSLRIKRNGVLLPFEEYGSAYLGHVGYMQYHKVTENTVDTLPDPYDKAWAEIGGIVWVSQYNGTGYTWVNTEKTAAEYFTRSLRKSVSIRLQANDTVFIEAELSSDRYVDTVTFSVSGSAFTFGWLSRGKNVAVDMMTPHAVATAILDKITDGKSDTFVSISNFDSRIAKTYMMAAESARGIAGAKLYTSFNDFAEWMSVVFGYVYYVEGDTVNFVHRSELFNSQSVRKIENCRDVAFSIDSAMIYSTVVAGYEKKDYDKANGRDEFNFNNTYTTGCSVSDKTLTLKSKYRADCYGIEFAVQKRSEDTTDTSSDMDVFFAYCVPTGTRSLMVDRTAGKVENALSNYLFNGAYSPMACILANAGLIGLQSDSLTLAFASSEGNTAIVVGGKSMGSDISIDSTLATCGVIEFSTSDVEEITNVNQLIEIEDNGVVYRGYLLEADLKFAKEEAAKYKLIVKEIVL